MAAIILDQYNLALITIVGVFWLLVIRRAILVARPWFPNLLIVPAFFIIAGIVFNFYRHPWGTYLVGGLHVLMLIMLAIKLSRR